MSDFNRGYTSPISARADMAVDAGLRAFMLGVYNKLALGLIVSAALAFVTADIPAVRDQIYIVDGDGRLLGFTLLGTVLRFAPLAVMLVGMFGMRNVTPRSSGIFYWTIVSLIGAGLGVWMLAYTGVSVASTFLITAAAFGTLSLVGYTTKKDLTGFGNFLIMGVVGILIAMVANRFLHLPGMALIVNILGVLIFAGLTAYDTQRLKMSYYQLGGSQTALSIATNYGALGLYINFINLFQFLLALTGNRR
jgi:FtsH-binding integral membrane protein